MEPSDQRLDDLGTLQRSVMEILWDLEEASVHEVRDALSEGDRQPAYTTVLSVLQKLEKAGWVEHRKSGRTYIYGPCRSRAQAGASALKGFVNRVFEGDPLLLFQHLIEGDGLKDRDLARLRRMIDDKRKGQGT